MASTFVEIRDAALLTAAIATPIALVMWSSWDPNDRWSRAKHFVVSGIAALGIAAVIVGAYFGLWWWLRFSLGAIFQIAQSLPSWLVPTIAIAFGLIAALCMGHSELSRTTSRWRWLVIVFVPFWALHWIVWLGKELLGLLLLLPLLPLFMWGEKHEAEVAKKQYMAYRKKQEMRERARFEYMVKIRQQIADKHAVEKKWREEAPLRAEQKRLRNLERSRVRRAAEKEAQRVRQADKAMKDHIYTEIYRTEGFTSRASKTREVKLRIVSPEAKVSPPSITLPVGDYVGYVETIDFDAEGVQNLKLVMLFLDEATVGKLGLNEQQRPIKFEVLRHIRSGAIQLIEE